MEIRVYYNLHKRCLSIQEKVNGAWRVARYAEQCIVKNAKFKVSEAGRQRVLKEQRKNVHAAIVGRARHIHVCVAPTPTRGVDAPHAVADPKKDKEHEYRP